MSSLVVQTIKNIKKRGANMWIEGRWFEEPELSAYIRELKEEIAELKQECAILENKVDCFEEYELKWRKD